MEYHFVIDMVPVAKARARVFAQGGKIRAVTPTKTRNAESIVRDTAVVAGVKPIDGPVGLTLKFRYRPPKSWSKRKTEKAIESREFKITMPDLDNLAKLVKDALNGVAWCDDRQVAWSVTEKSYGPRDEIDVRICSLEDSE